MRKRTIKKQIWINQTEDNLLKAKAQKSGLNESEFLRSCIKGYKIKEQPTKEISEFIPLNGIKYSDIDNMVSVIEKHIKNYQGHIPFDYKKYNKENIKKIEELLEK